MSKKILSLMLSLVFLYSECAFPAHAADDTPDQLQRIFDDLNAKDTTCDTVEQQAVNGIYHLNEVLTLIAFDLQNDDDQGEHADAILNEQYSFDASCQGPEQQLANGADTLVDLVTLISIEAVEKGHDEIDGRATTVEQQIVNGLYNCVQMAGILSMQYA